MKDFIKNTGLMVILTTLSSGLNYLCQIVLGRVVSVDTYGSINMIFSLILILNVPGTSMSVWASRYTSRFNQSEITDNDFRLVYDCGMRTTAIFGAVSSIVVFAFVLFYRLDKRLILPLIFAIVSSYLPVIESGALAGLKRFIPVAVFTFFVPIGKVLAVAIVWLLPLIPLYQKGIMLMGICLGNIAMYASEQYYLKKKFGFVYRENRIKRNKWMSWNTSALSVVQANFMYLLVSNLDILLITYVLGGIEAGLYSSAMMFGRIIFFMTSSLVTVLVPYVAGSATRHSQKKVLVYSICISVAISVGCIIPVSLKPEIWINMMFGKQYVMAMRYVLVSCINAVLLALLNLNFGYCVSIEKTRVFIKSIIAFLVIVFGLVFFRNNDVNQITTSILIGLLVLLSIQYTLIFGKPVSEEKQN